MSSTLTIPERISALSLRVQEMDNPSLVEPETSPNGNMIYHIYNDGEITSQKGGWAYMRSSKFTIIEPLPNADRLGLKFKREIETSTGQMASYSIVTCEQADEIRKEIKELLMMVMKEMMQAMPML
jgi:hypothetical protein